MSPIKEKLLGLIALIWFVFTIFIYLIVGYIIIGLGLKLLLGIDVFPGIDWIMIFLAAPTM